MGEPEEKKQQEYEDRLQRRLQILKKQFDEGKIKIAEGLKVIDSLKAVRYRPDGLVDLDTVDGLVRSMALTVEHFHEREELKKSVSLSEIQNAYFSFLEQNFGHFFQEMKKHDVTPHDIARHISSNISAVHELITDLPNFLSVLKEFWEGFADVARIHVEDMHGILKGVFGGDLFPAHNENIASKCGIYTDTIILPDPFMRSLDLFERWEPDKKAYYLIKHALNLLQYKELACADMAPPIVVVIPDRTALEKSEKDFIAQLGESDALIHAGKVFGREFESIEDLIEFSRSLNTLDKLMPKIVDTTRILFDTEWKGNAEDQIARAMKDQHAQLLGTDNPGLIVASHTLGRMCTSNELLIKAGRMKGPPIIDAPTSWQYFVWKIEYDAEHKERDNDVKDFHVLRGLQSLSENEMEWLGRVPNDALLEIRKTGALDEIRNILGKGIDELTKADPANFHFFNFSSLTLFLCCSNAA